MERPAAGERDRRQSWHLMRILLLGGTDLTLAVANKLLDMGIRPAGVVHVGRVIPISYAPEGFGNARYVNLGGWCRDRGVPDHPYADHDALLAFAVETGAEFALVAGWYHLLPAQVRSAFPRGCAGLHASLLPKFRGGAPLNWAILDGETETGVSLFALGDGVDDGPIWGQKAFAIPERATIGDLVKEAEEASLQLIETLLPAIAKGGLRPRPQKGTPSYRRQRRPEDGRIDWTRPAADIDQLVRAVSRPYPGAFTSLGGDKVVIWRSQPISADAMAGGAPGQIFREPTMNGACATTGEGGLVIQEATYEDGEDSLQSILNAAGQHLGEQPI